MPGALFALIVIAIVILDLVPAAKAATEGRLQFSRFGPDGTEATYYTPPFTAAFPLGRAAFDQAGQALTIVNKPECVDRFGLQAGLQPVPLSAICGLEFGASTGVAVDNSGGPRHGSIYTFFSGTEAKASKVFGFDAQGDPLGSPFPFSPAGSVPGHVLRSIAVDSKGDIWIGEGRVGEEEDARITEYNGNGTPTGLVIKTPSEFARDIAFDSSDNLYGLFESALKPAYVRKYLAPAYTESTVIDSANPAGGSAIAVDGDHLLVARTGPGNTNEDHWVDEYDSSGAEISGGSPFFVDDKGEETSRAFTALAVDESNGVVYVAEDGGFIYAISRYGIHPDSVTGKADEVATKSARLTGTVNPNGKASTCEFEWGETEAFGHTAKCEASPGAGTKAVEVSAKLPVDPLDPEENLKPSTTYFFRLDGRNGIGLGAPGAIGQFTTAGRPSITESALDAATGVTATASARIKSSEASSYFVEYGTDEGYGRATAKASVPGGKPLNGWRRRSAVSSLGGHTIFASSRKMALEAPKGPTLPSPPTRPPRRHRPAPTPS